MHRCQRQPCESRDSPSWPFACTCRSLAQATPGLFELAEPIWPRGPFAISSPYGWCGDRNWDFQRCSTCSGSSRARLRHQVSRAGLAEAIAEPGHWDVVRSLNRGYSQIAGFSDHQWPSTSLVYPLMDSTPLDSALPLSLSLHPAHPVSPKIPPRPNDLRPLLTCLLTTDCAHYR